MTNNKTAQELDNELKKQLRDEPINIQAEVNMIWSIANKLRGTYTSDKYRDVIIPMTIIRRFECALEETKEDVLKAWDENPGLRENYKFLCSISGHQFYNTSRFTLEILCNDSTNIRDNFINYLEGFSSNVQEILLENGLNFLAEIDKMDRNDRLYGVVKDFSELDLSPDRISNVNMGYIFEDLIRRFSENAEAGDHYTGRDIIHVMVEILLAEGSDDVLKDDYKIVTVLDQACGTGGMLSIAEEGIKTFNPTADVRLFGQEVNPESYSICKADMMIKGQEAKNIAYINTLKEDAFKGQKMRYVIMNPPFGTAWGGKDAPTGSEQAVEKEYDKGFDGRWGAGLPAKGDSQLLFMQSAIDKMDEKLGRTAIIQNGSSLSTGGVSSGESQIRRWMLEEDLIEAIIALPEDLFYNTGIATYIWILSKNKSERRKGKVQLINGIEFYEPLRKSLGDKRVEITENNRKKIVELYANFEENEYSKIFDNEDFIYREYVVKQPLQRSYAINDERIERLISSGNLNRFYNPVKYIELQGKDSPTKTDRNNLKRWQNNEESYHKIFEILEENKSDKKYLSEDEFLPILEDLLTGVTQDKKLIKSIADGLSIMDKEAKIVKNPKGEIEYDNAAEYKDTERVPLKVDIDDYMKEEVLPHIPDAKAFFEENLGLKKPRIRTGAEIPFNRYFFDYTELRESKVIAKEIVELERTVAEEMNTLFGEV